MPTTIEQLKGIFSELKVNVEETPEHLGHFTGWWTTENFLAADGKKHIALCFELSTDGEYFRVLAPHVYSLKDSRFKGHALAVLAQIAFDTRSLQCEYDSSDGEVRYEIDHWILDSQLTAKQVILFIRFMLDFADRYHPVVLKAKDEGKIDFECEWKRPEPAKADEPPLTPDLAELIRRAGGAEGLAKLLAERAG
jgi:hypothetical protein